MRWNCSCVYSNICWCVCCLKPVGCVAFATVAHLRLPTNHRQTQRQTDCMWLNILFSNWATVQLTVLHLCEKPLASSWLLNPQIPDLCSLCLHPAGSKCVTACQQVAWRPVFVLACVCTVYTHTHIHIPVNTLHTWAAKSILDMTHTEQTGNRELWCNPVGTWGHLSIFVYVSFLSLYVLFNVPSLRSLF